LTFILVLNLLTDATDLLVFRLVGSSSSWFITLLSLVIDDVDVEATVVLLSQN